MDNTSKMSPTVSALNKKESTRHRRRSSSDKWQVVSRSKDRRRHLRKSMLMFEKSVGSWRRD